MTSIARQQSRASNRRIGPWALRTSLASMFAGAGLFKLSGSATVSGGVDQVGLGQRPRFGTTSLELTDATLLLWPQTVAAGAIALMIVCIGAFVAQVMVLHGDVAHTVVLASVLATFAWTHRTQSFGTSR